jgi:hypothetical protein
VLGSETIEPGVAEGFGAIGVAFSGFSSLTAAMGVRDFGGDFENPNYLFFVFIFGELGMWFACFAAPPVGPGYNERNRFMALVYLKKLRRNNFCVFKE